MRWIISGVVVLMTAVCLASPQDLQPASAPAVPTGERSGQWIVVYSLNAEGAKDPWMGKAVQQTIFTDLIQRTRAHVQSPQGESPRGIDATLHAAREANGTFAVSGDVQSAGNEIRITGQVLEVATGTVLGGFKATGPATQLFSLEDSVAAQVIRALPATLAIAQPQITTTVAQPQNQVYNQYYSQPATTYPQTTTTYVYPDYSPYTYSYSSYPYTYDSYPYYYSYPYVGIGGVFIGGFGGRFHEGFHGGFGHEGFRGGFGGRTGIGVRGSVGGGHAGGGHR